MSSAGTLVVVNPASGHGQTGRRWPSLRAALHQAGVTFEHRVTSSEGDATALTRAALRAGCERVVAVGGDGTLNEVLNGFFEEDGSAVSPEAVLGLLPSGTGGDFRRTAGIPATAGAACALLARADVRSIDVGRIDYLGATPAPPRIFVNVADCGIGGDVVSRVNNGRRVGNGTTTFYWHSVAALLAFRSRLVRVDVDGVVREGPMANVAVCNGRYFGGGMKVAPEAGLADGRFDVVLVGDIPRRRAIWEMRRIYAGRHLDLPSVEVLHGSRVTVTPLEERTVLFDVDGEQIGAAPARLRCLSRALRICAPPAAGG